MFLKIQSIKNITRIVNAAQCKVTVISWILVLDIGQHFHVSSQLMYLWLSFLSLCHHAHIPVPVRVHDPEIITSLEIVKEKHIFAVLFCREKYAPVTLVLVGLYYVYISGAWFIRLVFSVEQQPATIKGGWAVIHYTAQGHTYIV